MQNQHTSPLEPASTGAYFKKAIEIVKLNRHTMAEVASDPHAIRFGIAVTAVGGALAFIPGNSLVGGLVGALFSVFILFLFAGLVHLLCGYSRGKEEFMGFVRIIGLSGIIDWMVILPFTALVITVWSIVISVVAAQKMYQLTRDKAILVVIISALILWTISLQLFAGPLSFLQDVPAQ